MMGDLREGGTLYDQWQAGVLPVDPPAQPPAQPVSEAVTVEELEKLRRAHKALGEIYDMAFEAVERGRIFEPTDVPMIALGAKIVQQAGWGLGK